jgi:hypothetical protein
MESSEDKPGSVDQDQVQLLGFSLGRDIADDIRWDVNVRWRDPLPGS